ncbi:hypothetical protein OG407_20975 [Streptomyces sp. NBC_01515]|uniref:hypothetical protein n=1 Tax=Streptomyces sp. NBC_01515 TaxID=2903890 RepID=UPI003865035E
MRPVDPSMWDRTNLDERDWQMILKGGTWRLEQFSDFHCEAAEFAVEVERWAQERATEVATHVEGRVVYVCLGEEAEEAVAAQVGGLDDEAKELRSKRWVRLKSAWEHEEFMEDFRAALHNKR